jgi:hypothetical protein
MGLILTKPAKIGEHRRMPGYELTEEDMVGRNIAQMDRLGYVKYVDDPPARRRSRREDDGE